MIHSGHRPDDRALLRIQAAVRSPDCEGSQFADADDVGGSGLSRFGRRKLFETIFASNRIHSSHCGPVIYPCSQPYCVWMSPLVGSSPHRTPQRSYPLTTPSPL